MTPPPNSAVAVERAGLSDALDLLRLRSRSA
jgi:hypothetical protein